MIDPPLMENFSKTGRCVACLSLLSSCNLRREERGEGEISIQLPCTHPPEIARYRRQEKRGRYEVHQPHTSSLHALHTHRHDSVLVTPGKLWVHYQETFASVPAEKGDGHGNTGEVGGDTRHTGGAALDQRDPRAHRPWRAWGRRPWRWVARRRVAWRWVVGRPTGGYRDWHRAILGAVLGGILETLCVWLPLWVPARRHSAIHPTLCATLSTGRCPAPSTRLLVLLRRCTGVLPLCPAVPRRMESGSPDSPIDGPEWAPQPCRGWAV